MFCTGSHFELAPFLTKTILPDDIANFVLPTTLAGETGPWICHGKSCPLSYWSWRTVVQIKSGRGDHNLDKNRSQLDRFDARGPNLILSIFPEDRFQYKISRGPLFNMKSGPPECYKGGAVFI